MTFGTTDDVRRRIESGINKRNYKSGINMAQETLKSLIAVIMTLPLQEQVIYELQDNISRHSQTLQPSEEQKARLRQAYLDSREGRVVSQEEAHQMMDEFAQEQYAVAV